MANIKRLKDPIYGYIDIPSEYVKDIVDTAVFQRLRRIIQTSYSPLYSSAIHNRFVHSLGVYHLGSIAYNKLEEEAQKKEIDTVQEYRNVFLLACLLHDVGHAPFSHTGEEFYLGEEKSRYKIHQILTDLVNDVEFKEDLPGDAKGAAPHEIMSAIIGIKEFKNYFNNSEERSLFARCITGYKYNKDTIENSKKNCLIDLLNSKVIDVDKLDYLIRDAFTTGFNTVQIDYIRLLTSLTLICTENTYELGYYKTAISVIENVVYAHDSERKWIQSHPVVLYENYILKHVISHLNKNLDKDNIKLFSVDALGEKGIEFSNNIKIKLLCDDDIIYLIKNIFPNKLSNEFFSRKTRRHPLWKSEAEYKTLFLGTISGGETLDEFEAAMEATTKYLTKNTDGWVINDSLIEKIENEMKEINQLDIDLLDKKAQEKEKNNILTVMKCLQDFSIKEDISCDYVLLEANQFNSSFSKLDFYKTKIVFPYKDGDKIALVGDIISSLEAKEKKREKFFYLFYNRADVEKEINIVELSKSLIKAFI